MNILILGTGTVEQKLINLCLKSHLLDKIYTASLEPLEGIPNIEYFSLEELIKKVKILQADITLVADKELIKSGITDEFRRNNCNIIAVNKKWFNLESSRLIAKQLISHYSMNIPEIIKAPMSFPIVIKTEDPFSTQIAISLQDLIEKRKNLDNKKIFLEEYLNGEILYLSSLWDGENLWNILPTKNLTEVQEERLNLYKTKLTFMLSDEKADFIGFFTSKLIWAKNDWYVLDYIMHIDSNFCFENINKDFLYILNSAIYQKLKEI